MFLCTSLQRWVYNLGNIEINLKTIWSCIYSGHIFLKKNSNLCCIYRSLVLFIERVADQEVKAESQWMEQRKAGHCAFQQITLPATNTTNFAGRKKKKLPFFFYSPHKARMIFSKHESVHVTASLFKPSNDFLLYLGFNPNF